MRALCVVKRKDGWWHVRCERGSAVSRDPERAMWLAGAFEAERDEGGRGGAGDPAAVEIVASTQGGRS